MASQHIEITGTASRYAASFRRMVDSARELQNEVTKMGDIATQIVNTDDYVAFATYLGTTEAEATTVKSLLDAFSTAINSASAINNVIDRLG